MKQRSVYFSIIIPALNEEKYLPKLLNDISKQSYDKYEVIVVDGGSTDKTTELCKEFAKKIPLKTITNRKKNVAFQRNIGAKNSFGQYLVFFDADVRVSLGFLGSLYRNIQKTKGLLFTTHLVANSKSQTQILLTELTNFIIDTFNTLGKPFAPGFDIIVEKGVFEKSGGFDDKLKLAEDHELVQRFRKMGVLLKVLKSPKLYPSFRRPERIGYLRFLTQYAVAGVYSFVGEPIKKELFDYPMGGHVFNIDPKNKKEIISVANINSFLKGFRNRVSKITKNIDLPF